MVSHTIIETKFRYICSMKRLCLIILLLLSLLTSVDSVVAQRYKSGIRKAYWGVDSKGDSTLYITLSEIRVYHRKRDLRNHQRMVRAVKKVYPLAIEAAKRMEGLDQKLAEFERRKDKRAYTAAIEDALKEEISPMLWKMTRYEGKILLKLIDRETDHTVFGIIKNFRSGFTAGFYQALAKLFGNDLKLEYDPEGEDEILEYIVKYYQAGRL